MGSNYEPENHGYINQGDHKGNVYFGLRDAPPQNHPNAIKCFQCPEYTWRKTADCVHCGADIQNYLECQKVRLEIYSANHQMNRLGCAILVTVALIGLSIWFNILWLTVVSVIAGAIFCGAVSKLEGHKNNLREKLYQLS